MIIDQQFGLIQFLVGFQDAVFDHFKRTSGAFARSEILKDKLFFPFPVIVEGRIVGKSRNQRIGNQLIFQLDLARLDAMNVGNPSPDFRSRR